MKKIKITFLLLCTLLSTIIFSTVIAFAKPEYTLPVTADGAILINAVTGDILYGKNITDKYAPASTTKIMTALLVLENCKDLNEKVTIPKEAENIDGSKIYIFKDEEITVKDLLYALLLSSANDCAYALAIHVGGTYENFIKMMNARAIELGCKNTTFTNPHGLYESNHRTCVNDLALIMKEVVKHDEYLKISTTPSYKMTSTNKCKEQRPLWNGNKAIHQYDSMYNKYTRASKTGYTVDSLHSYVTYVEKDGQKFIIALTHDKEKNFYNDSKSIMEFAFKNFSTEKVIEKNQIIKTVKLGEKNVNLIASEDVYVTIDKNLDTKPVLQNLDVASLKLETKALKKNDFIKSTFIEYNNKTFEVKTFSDSDYHPPMPANKLSGILKILLKSILIILGVCISLLFFLILTKVIIGKIRKKPSRNRSTRKYR